MAVFGVHDHLFKRKEVNQSAFSRVGREEEDLLAHTTGSPIVDLGLRIAKSKAEMVSVKWHYFLWDLLSGVLVSVFCEL